MANRLDGQQKGQDVTGRAPITGGCLCGRVRYRVEGAFGPVAHCHCTMCRKAQGAAFATNATVTSFTFVSGADALTEYQSSPGKYRCFCRVCGSPIYSRRDDTPDEVRVRFGLLDDDPGVRASYHFHVESKAQWFTITDGLPQHAARPTGT